jgi:hypothetical protein
MDLEDGLRILRLGSANDQHALSHPSNVAVRSHERASARPARYSRDHDPSCDPVSDAIADEPNERLTEALFGESMLSV